MDFYDQWDGYLKKKFNLNLTFFYNRISSNWIKNLNKNNKTMKVPEESIWDILLHAPGEKAFLMKA